MPKTVVINVAGLDGALLLGRFLPRLRRWAGAGFSAAIKPVVPALAAPQQATYLTGCAVREHGVVGNGWYDHADCEVRFHRLSGRHLQRPALWETARQADGRLTCASLFWHHNLYAGLDLALAAPPGGGLAGEPGGLAPALERALGRFHGGGLRGARWVAAAARWIVQRHDPDLTLIRLSYLDDTLQRLGPDHPGLARPLAAFDELCAELIACFEARSAQVVVLSDACVREVRRPVPLNRVLRVRGLLQVREERGGEVLEAGTSEAFAVADHQVAHVYLRQRHRQDEVRRILEEVPGVARVLNRQEQARHGLDHPRGGELLALAEPDAWFSYQYWLDDRRAPRHLAEGAKPGYDPLDLFHRPRWFDRLTSRPAPDPTRVRGSHGLAPRCSAEAPVMISRRGDLIPCREIEAAEVHDLLLAHLVDLGQLRWVVGMS